MRHFGPKTGGGSGHYQYGEGYGKERVLRPACFPALGPGVSRKQSWVHLEVVDTLGRALRDLRISLTDRCNFRCVYCMPKAVFGPAFHFMEPESLLNREEISRLVRVFARLGVTKIRLTGGEPQLRKDLEGIVHDLHDIDGIEEIVLTTNGSALSDPKPSALKQRDCPG